MITAIIPTLNEAAHIGPLLRQLLADGPETLVDVCVADGGSVDGTQAIVAEISNSDPRVRLLHNPRRLQAAGVNLAAESAPASVTTLVRIDAHSGYPQHYVRDLAALLATTGADSVVVRLRTVAQACFQRAVAAVSNSKLGTGGSAHRAGGLSGWIDHGHHAAFRRSSFAAAGGYDPAFRANEDAELDVRLRRAGGRIWFAAEIEVDYHPRETAGRLARQYFHYGAGRAQNWLKNGERLRPRQWAPPILVTGLILGLLVAPWAPWSLLAPAAYFAACILAGAVFALRSGDVCRFGAAVALPAMHLGWGSGFILALARRGIQTKT